MESGIEKTLTKLRESIKNGGFYEAHQMYRTVHRRLVKQGKLNDALTLVYAGAEDLLKANQLGSGLDLALLVADLYESIPVPVNEDYVGKCLTLFYLFPDKDVVENGFIKRMIKYRTLVLQTLTFRWSARFGKNSAGEPALHHLFAERLLQQKHYAAAMEHFILGFDEGAPACAKLIHAWANEEDIKSEQEKFYMLAKAITQYLCLKQIKRAKTCFDLFIADLPKAPEIDRKVPFGLSKDSPEIPVYCEPLLNYCQVLILLAQRDAAQVFPMMKKHYGPIIGDINEGLDHIGTIYFNIAPPRNSQSGLNDLLKAVMGG